MKKITGCLVLFIFLTQLQLKAQTQYPAVSAKFMQFYNAEAADSIFMLYSPELQEKLPSEKTKTVISGLHIQFGELKSLQVLKKEDGFNIYKAAFQQQTKCLFLELNTDNQINGYRLVDYKPEYFQDDKKQ